MKIKEYTIEELSNIIYAETGAFLNAFCKKFEVDTVDMRYITSFHTGFKIGMIIAGYNSTALEEAYAVALKRFENKIKDDKLLNIPSPYQKDFL